MYIFMYILLCFFCRYPYSLYLALMMRPSRALRFVSFAIVRPLKQPNIEICSSSHLNCIGDRSSSSRDTLQKESSPLFRTLDHSNSLDVSEYIDTMDVPVEDLEEVFHKDSACFSFVPQTFKKEFCVNCKLPVDAHTSISPVLLLKLDSLVLPDAEVSELFV